MHPGSPLLVSLQEKGRTAFAPSFKTVAEWTGLEPATPGVTGRYSNQLNYHSNTYRKATGVLAFSDHRARTLSRFRAIFTLTAQPQTLNAILAGGCYRGRTCDLRLVRATLYQLS